MIRKILFGYQIQGGELVIQPQEATAVRHIFSLYLSGEYQWKIADILNADGIIYSQERPQWNKYRTAFILKNPRYMGADDYPVIIDSDIFQMAQEIIRKRRKSRNRIDRPALHYGEMLRCGQCRGHLKRQFSGKKRADTLYLQCGGCGARIRIMDADLLAEIKRQTAEYVPPERNVMSYEPSGEVIRLTNAINRGLERPKQPENIAKLILQGISARYDCFAGESSPMDGSSGPAIQYITITAENAVTVTFKG